jgi:ABC-type sugar transport system ATPase subunit
MDPVPPKGLFPFLHGQSPPMEPSRGVERDAILHVTFASKKDKVVGGGFTDYTARYGAMRDQDGQTLRESLLESLTNEPPSAPPTEFTPGTGASPGEESVPKVRRDEIERVASRLHLVPQLDIPMIALSNGQRRRARILRRLIRHPRLLLLEDPFGAFRRVARGILISTKKP